MPLQNEFEISSKLLNNYDITPTIAVRLILETIENFNSPTSLHLVDIRKIMELGIKQFKLQKTSKTFDEIRKKYIEINNHLHKRTLSDIQQLTNRFIRTTPSIGSQLVCDFDTNFCEKILYKTYSTACQRRKGLVVMKTLFNFALRKGWLTDNPWCKIDLPHTTEKEIRILDPKKAQKLIQTAQKNFHGETLPPIAIMMYAGIRPEEIKRLEWSAINLEESIITLRPQHTKTGGARHVTIPPILHKILTLSLKKREKEHQKSSKTKMYQKITPKGWVYKWKAVRQIAGWSTPKSWTPDTLRHTFASYHLSRFQNIPLLQLEMGHSSSTMLRTRYLNMEGITRSTTQAFWDLNAI